MVDKADFVWWEERLGALIRQGLPRSGLPHGTPVELRRVALALAARDVLSHLVEVQVIAARRAGRTWDEIGLAMGDKSRQAAQKRFGHLG